MSPLANPYGGGFMPPQNILSTQAPSFLRPNPWQAINALTPTLFRAAGEHRAIYGAVPGAILVNSLANVSYAASGNFRIRGHNGKAVPLALYLRFAGPPLSGKTEARDRFIAPVIEAMTGWKKPWRFGNVTLAALLRKIRSGSGFSMLEQAEGGTHLGDTIGGQLSRSFSELNDLHDANVPPFNRADDDEVIENALESAIFVMCVNVQNDKNRAWLDKYARGAMEAGYLYRLLILEAEDVAVAGAGTQQPEMALLDYDQRIVELLASARLNLETVPANRLPVLEVMPSAEQVLQQAQESFFSMASSVLSPNEARVFAVRLAANARRIAGCMHVFERYEGDVSDDTMARAATIAECFGGHWLATTFPPQPMSDAQRRAMHFLGWLYSRRDRNGERILVHRKSDLEVEAPNFGWTKAEMAEVIKIICGYGLARVVRRTENGRRVINFELIEPPVAFQQTSWGLI
ncbi:DUF3987 domain-containing protein [Burkholderia territorii]|uniref:DUF3987 domain-containing protein n=1 Tax=Burkholderia territorii TaxID=1503055 RepID=UPI00075DB06C|nr:DUF3987 domain-containing protein [Burkholderia territorii]KWA13942.1 hypothetical protein WT38_02770 [Burkholderia territorii]